MINTSQNMLYHIGNLNTENQRISYQMATGKNMDKGSENSLLHANLIDLDDKLRVTEGLMLQITKSKVINETADSSIEEMKRVLGTGENTIQTDLLKGLNSGMQRSDKLALATNLRGVRDNMYDAMNARVDGEYVFTGSETSKRTLAKDVEFKLNGKIEFGGDGFLREIAVQPGSYRDRGVTAYDVAFHNYDDYDGIDRKADPENWDGKAYAGEQIVFSQNDRIIDEEGFEWKISSDSTKIQKYDYNGDIYHPPIEIDLYRTTEPMARIDLGMDTNTGATGDYSITLDGTNYSYTPIATDGAQEIRDALANFIAIANPGVYNISALDNDDKFYISTVSGAEMSIDVTDQNLATPEIDTNTNYNMTISNEVEATGTNQGRVGTYTFTAPSDPAGRVFEAKHNYFEDLNIIINALEGHSTQIDGTKGPVIDDELVRSTVSNGLEQTSKQFDATNIGHGELGGRNSVFNVAYDKLLAQQTHYNILIQETGGADMAKLAMESKALELTYQSLYTTISKMNKLSLLNYIN